MQRSLPILAVFAATLLVGCELPTTQPTAATPQPLPQKLVKVDVPLDNPETKLLLSNLQLGPANTGVKDFRDLRPYWTVHGRIQNITVLPIRSIRLQAHMKYRDTEVETDSTVFSLREEIPPNSTVSFVQVIQILAPERPWYWSCGVIDAHTDAYQPASPSLGK